MKKQMQHIVIAIMALIISAPAILCVFETGSFTPAYASSISKSATSKQDPHAQHDIQHNDRIAGGNTQQSSSMACLICCLDKTDEMYLTASGPDRNLTYLPESEQKYSLPLQIHASISATACFTSAAPPPPDISYVASARTLLIKKSLRIRL